MVENPPRLRALGIVHQHTYRLIDAGAINEFPQKCIGAVVFGENLPAVIAVSRGCADECPITPAAEGVIAIRRYGRGGLVVGQKAIFGVVFISINALTAVLSWGREQAMSCFGVKKRGITPDRIRTCDLRFRKPTLYPTELRAQNTY